MRINFVITLFVIVFVSHSWRVSGQRTDYEGLAEQEYFYAFTEATRHYLFGNYVQAIHLYKECLKIKPQSSTVHFQLAKIYLNAGNISLAREHAKSANDFTDRNRYYLQKLGDIFQMEEKFDSAIVIYKQLLSIDPENVNNVFAIASMYEKIGRYNEALTYLTNLDELIGLTREASLSRFRIYEAINEPDKAIIALKTANLISGDDYSLTGLVAEFYQRNNQPDSADKYYRLVYPRFKDDPVVVFSYAGFLLEQGKSDSAQRLLIEVMNDTAVDNMIKAGYFYSAVQDEEKFIIAKPILNAVSEAYIANHNNDIRSLSIYADVQLRLRNYPAAANVLTRIVDRDITNYPALEQLIFALNILGKTDSMIAYCNKGISAFPDKPVLYLFCGSGRYQKKEYEAALNVLKKGMALTEDKALKLEFLSLLAETYQGTLQYAESEAAFNAALEIDENNMGIKNNYAYYLSLREKNLGMAKRMSLSTIKSEPENATYLDTYAWILFKMGKVGQAKKVILKAVAYGGVNNEEILKHCADIHLELREYAEAVRYLKKVMAIADSVDTAAIQLRITQIEKMNLK